MDNERFNILKLLIENQEKTFSIRQIAIIRKINYKSAYNAIQSLAKEGVISLENKGNITLCSFSRKFNDSVFIVEDYRLHELLKNKNFQIIYNRICKVNAQFILLLFGSYAKKQESKHSDIDLLVISNDAKPIEVQIKLLPLNIHLTSITYENFIALLKSKEFTVVSEAIKHNILLFGIEDYYRLINNAR